MASANSGGPPEHEKGQPAIWQAALFGSCPRCGERTLFDGIVRFASSCRACGLNFAKFNVGDGPAAFLILVVGAMVVGLAAWLEVSAAPPAWVHVVLWAPMIVVLTLGGLRIAKAALLASEFRHEAKEAGSIDP